jgi:hypothetical protein
MNSSYMIFYDKKGVFTMSKKFLAILPIIAMLLFSCYSQKIYLNQDKKSGKMVIDYTMDNDYLSILSTALVNFQSSSSNGKIQKITPNALIDQKIFKDTFKDSEDVKLKTVSIKTSTVNKKSFYQGHIEVTFSDFEKALKMLPEGLLNITVSRDNDKITINQIINMSKMDPKNVFLNFLEEEKEVEPEIYNKLTKEAVFNFYFETKSSINKVEGGSLIGNNKNNVLYKFSINDLLKNKDKDMKFLISF